MATDEFDALLVKLVGFAATDNVEGIADACSELRRLYHFTAQDFDRAYRAGVSAAHEAFESRLNAGLKDGSILRCVNCGTLYDLNK